MEYLYREPSSSYQGRAPAIFMLHGYGSHEEDLFSLASHFPSSLHVFSFRAPHQVSEYGYAWYPLSFDENGQVVQELDRKVIMAAADLVGEQVNSLVKAHQLDEGRLFLIGFSQGCILSYLIAMLQSTPVKYVVGLSGYSVRPFLTWLPKPIEPSTLKIFTSHGQFDEVIPVDKARATKELFDELGVDMVYREYPIGHAVDFEVLKDVLGWMDERLGKVKGVLC